MTFVSVVVCSHNSPTGYLTRVLAALRAQTLPQDRWELLVVDNASNPPLRCELAWHFAARQIDEPNLGLTRARLRGISESRGDLIVFVDDDNVLDPDFLEQAVRIGAEWPRLGAWGGEIRPAFEVEPPPWTKKYWPFLAVRQFDRDMWSNLLGPAETTPCGAGLVVRQAVARYYMEEVRRNPVRLELDRKGEDLTSAGDTDLALCSITLGLGTGYFNALKLWHLIPPARLEERYLLRLYERSLFSRDILDRILYGKRYRNSRPSVYKRLIEALRRARMDARTRRFERARLRALEAAENFVRRTPLSS